MSAAAGNRTARPSEPPTGYLLIGRLGRSFRLAGEVRLQVSAAVTDDELAALLETLVERGCGMFVAGLGETSLRGFETPGGALVVRLRGLRDREAARALVNAEVHVSAADLPSDLAAALGREPAEDALVGLPVLIDGEPAGTVAATFLDVANPYVEVALRSGGAALVPLMAPYVALTDDALSLTEPPSGLLD